MCVQPSRVKGQKSQMCLMVRQENEEEEEEDKTRGEGIACSRDVCALNVRLALLDKTQTCERKEEGALPIRD